MTNEWCFVARDDYMDYVEPMQWPITHRHAQSQEIVNRIMDTYDRYYVTDRIELRPNTIGDVFGYDVFHVHTYDELDYDDVLGFMYLSVA